MIPVGDALALVYVAQVLAEIVDTGLGCLEEAIFTGHVKGGRQAIDQPGDRIGLLAVAHLVAGHVDPDAVLPPVRLALGKLGAVVKVGHLVDLLDPPVGLLEAVARHRPPPTRPI